MKKTTMQKRTQIANAVMYYIYRYIDSDINLDTLCQELKISKFYMHRIFKEEFGKNIYESIKSIRLQKASNLLITNHHSTISQIASMCGYSSSTSFIRAFRERFHTTPKQWRSGAYREYSKNILRIYNQKSFDVEPTILKLPKQHCYYIRHQGYDRSIKKTWQKLHTWLLCNDIEHYTQVGLHHDNPIITPLSECQYVAGVIVENEVDDTSLPSLTIPQGIYAKFYLEGVYGDVLEFIRWVYHTWLVESGYETTTTPSFALYHQNHFLSKDEHFSLEYYLPVRFV